MANALEAASLIMVPSGYEDGTLGSLKPTDGSGDFTFSRGSNLSATRINEQGYIEKGYENLLLQSNTFTNAAWDTYNLSSITGGQIGYDGTNDAWVITKIGANGFVRQNISQGGVSVFSVYTKRKDSDYIRFGFSGGSFSQCYFSLIDGASREVNVLDSNSENIGDGWWRLSVTLAKTISNVIVYPAESLETSSGPSGSVYIQDAMLNQGLVAYPYIETTTAPVAGGILEDEPRIDFSDGCGHLLLEPSRTNLIKSSEYITSNHWQLVGSTTELSSVTSPDGISRMTQVNFSGGYFSYIRFNTAFSAGSVTSSIFVKRDENSDSFAQLRVLSIDNNIDVWYDLINGVVANSIGSPINTSIEDFGNGIFRISATTSSTSDLSGAFVFSSASSDSTYASSGATMYFWGAQVEQDATYPTSYIPTYGVSQTRLGDSATDAGNVSTFNSTEGVLLFEGSILDLSGPTKAINISASNPNIHSLNLKWRSGTQQMQIIGVVNSGLNIGATFGVSEAIQLSNSKYAMVWNSTNVKIYINGNLITNQSLSTPFVADSFTECNILSAGEIFYGRVKQFILFPTALSDSECIALTTI